MQYALSHCEYTENYSDGEHTYTFTGKCVVTGKIYSVTVPAQGLFRYHQGEYIQKAFPNVSAEDREFLMSGISPEGWNEQLDEDEDVEDVEDVKDEESGNEA